MFMIFSVTKEKQMIWELTLEVIAGHTKARFTEKYWNRKEGRLCRAGTTCGNWNVLSEFLDQPLKDNIELLIHFQSKLLRNTDIYITIVVLRNNHLKFN